MKKLITILAIMIIVVGAAFAATEKIEVKVTLDQIAPLYSLLGSKTADGSYTAVNGGEIVYAYSEVTERGADADKGSITAYFMIKQNNISRFNGTSGTLTLVADKLYRYDGTTKNEKYYSDFPECGNVEKGDDIEDPNDETKKSFTVTTFKVDETNKYQADFEVTYNGTPVDGTASTVEVGHCSFTWSKLNALAVGTYKADVTLTYSPQ